MADNPQTPIVVIVGATAVGKTRAAVELCQWLGGEIVGADSVQVYRGFDIGSAKPSPEELGAVRHHMIDVAEPDNAMDAAAYARLADRAVAEAASRGAVPVVAGGAGLWVRALVRGLLQVPAVDESIRSQLELEWTREGPAEMHRQLQSVDPAAAAKIHPHDRMRVVRALEVYRQTGTAMGQLRESHALGAPRYRALCLNVDIAPAHLHQRLKQRARDMIEAGWADEVTGLLDRYGPGIRPLSSVGYRQMVEHVANSEPLEATESKIVKVTRLYARRQRNWFKSDPDVECHITPADLSSDAIRKRILSHLGR